MNIDHSAPTHRGRPRQSRAAEYLALWKSHKRAEWEAVRLRQAADALNHQVAGATGGEKQLQQESQRMWVLHSEIGAELARVAAALTPRQRKNTEKMLKQWEQEAKAPDLEA